MREYPLLLAAALGVAYVPICIAAATITLPLASRAWASFSSFFMALQLLRILWVFAVVAHSPAYTPFIAAIAIPIVALVLALDALHLTQHARLMLGLGACAVLVSRIPCHACAVLVSLPGA